MLTDLHVHLRADDRAATAERYFTPANVERYREAAETAGITDLGVSEHIYRFSAALEIWDHELWRESAVDDIERYVDFLHESELLAGIEADFVAGAEDRIGSLLDSLELDYVIGSVHFLGDGDQALDHGDYDVWASNPDPERIWSRYFELLAESARSGLFDVIAHPDLVKMWGAKRPVPERDPRFFYEPFAAAVADSGVAVEISTAGLRKPVGEIYPGEALGEMLVDAGAVFCLSSDAHRPQEIGFGYEQGLAALERWGVTEIATFRGRERRTEPVG
ncbi:histidinol-phosphatase [Thermoleophilia bacterium SCSIO 60948]|nr:histidinol-phosphatase [Thermoleophilia bacterium SCSIO 60948]